MLTREGLQEQAKLLGLPLNKQRAIIREYTQTIVLKAIYQSEFGQKLLFKGGTALRFAYGLGRFSEDLDFTGQDFSIADFTAMIAVCRKALNQEGFKCVTSEKNRKNIKAGWIKLTNVLQEYKITNIKSEKLMIKLEVSLPECHLQKEPAVIDRYGYLFTVSLMEKGGIFAEKIDALLRRCRGRDIYDLIFLLRNKFLINDQVFQAKGWQITPRQAILEKMEKLTSEKLNRLAAQLEPFLLKEEEKEYIINAKTYIKALNTT